MRIITHLDGFGNSPALIEITMMERASSAPKGAHFRAESIQVRTNAERCHSRTRPHRQAR
jgi:hypothetical protein